MYVVPTTGRKILPCPVVWLTYLFMLGVCKILNINYVNEDEHLSQDKNIDLYIRVDVESV